MFMLSLMKSQLRMAFEKDICVSDEMIARLNLFFLGQARGTSSVCTKRYIRTEIKCGD